MLRRSFCAYRGVFHNAPTTYPFIKPFHDTPHDQDRTRFDVTNRLASKEKRKWPLWMDEGADGTGHGIGLHRTHPLSPLKGNLRRSPSHVPRVMNMMIQGVWHKSGNKLYFRGGKPPNPSTHPFLTGEPCPIYGWRVLDENATREFNVPQIDKEKMTYKPYVALHEKRLMPSDVVSHKPPGPVQPEKDQRKPLVKRLFFWQ